MTVDRQQVPDVQPDALWTKASATSFSHFLSREKSGLAAPFFDDQGEVDTSQTTTRRSEVGGVVEPEISDELDGHGVEHA